MTKHFEVPFQPEIGSNIQKLLFEPLDSVTGALVEMEIKQIVQNFEPRASISFIQIFPDYDKNGFSVGMEFFIVNRTDPITIQFFLERVR